jgi:2,4-dienoyl-CoA reductase-like NADH-dependent reductase (Old Yellow Enzyme family)
MPPARSRGVAGRLRVASHERSARAPRACQRRRHGAGGLPLNPQPRSDRFAFKTADALRRRADALGITLPYDEDVRILLEETAVGGRRVPNRIAAQPMEGCDASPDGAPTELTLRRYERFGAGGAGLIWVEATGIAPDARANSRQLCITPATWPGFRSLVEVARAAARQRFGPKHDPYLVLQLTHSGRFSRTAPAGGRRIACASPYLDREPLPAWTDGQLDGVAGAFVTAARLAARAGFDAVDIKACHGYLLHELLGAHTRANSRYGGPFENRTRLLLDIVSAVGGEVPEAAVAVRVSATDGVPFPYGFGVPPDGSAGIDLDEPKRLVHLLRGAGCALLNVTAGIPTIGPHLNRPFDRPVAGTAASPEHPLAGVSRLLALAAALQAEVPSVPVVATGFSWLRQFWPPVAAGLLKSGGAQFAGVGRGMFAYPDAPAALMARGTLDAVKCCIACSRCTELMRMGSTAGCAVRDHPLYAGLHRRDVGAART